MHDCSKTQEKLFDLVLHELAAGEQAEVLADIAACLRCRSELESLEKTFDLCHRANSFNEPTAAEWQTYESNLQQRFQPRETAAAAKSWWRQIFFGSVRIPAPILAAALLFVSIAAFFAFREVKSESPAIVAGETQPLAPQTAPAVAAATPETIVIREERIITRKIYVAARQQQSARQQPKSQQQQQQRARGLGETTESPLNLAEFKPVRPIEPNTVKGSKPK